MGQWICVEAEQRRFILLVGRRGRSHVYCLSRMFENKMLIFAWLECSAFCIYIYIYDVYSCGRCSGTCSKGSGEQPQIASARRRAQDGANDLPGGQEADQGPGCEDHGPDAKDYEAGADNHGP